MARVKVVDAPAIVVGSLGQQKRHPHRDQLCPLDRVAWRPMELCIKLSSRFFDPGPAGSGNPREAPESYLSEFR